MLRRIVVLFVILAVMPPIASAAEMVSTVSKQYGVSLNLPDRWIQREDSKSNYFRVHAADGRDQANVMLTALPSRRESIDGWMEDRVTPGVLKGYAGDHAYQATTKKSQVTLGNGAIATVVAYDMLINTNRRSLVLMYWEQNAIWYWARISNSGWYWDIVGTGLLKQIAEGIK